jgi:hypothetical protein
MQRTPSAPLILNVLADNCRSDRESNPHASKTEDMMRGSRLFLILVGCVLLLCSACVLVELAGLQYTWTAGWPPRIYQALMTLLGIGIFPGGHPLTPSARNTWCRCIDVANGDAAYVVGAHGNDLWLSRHLFFVHRGGVQS